MKTLSAVAALLLLTGCQATFWAQPPSSQWGCDSAVQGRWYSEINYPEEGESEQVSINIDASCQVVGRQLVGGAIVLTSEPTSVRMARHQGWNYAWLDANALLAFDGNGYRTPAGDVMVFRYRVEGDQLQVWNINHLHVRSLINSGAVAGGFDDDEFNEFNRITGPVAPALLGAPELFAGQATVLTRAGGQP